MTKKLSVFNAYGRFFGFQVSNFRDSDTQETKKYKDLLNKEYAFCLKIMDAVIDKADKLYRKQISTGKVAKFCCDFKALEEVCDAYNSKDENR